MKRVSPKNEVEYNIPYKGIERKSVEFYKDLSTSLVATVKRLDGTGVAVDIYCDGDMRFVSREGDYYQEGADLIAAGYDTDKKLESAVESEELECRLNPWFDLYANGEHLDRVTHDIDDAIMEAEAFVEELSYSVEMLESCLK